MKRVSSIKIIANTFCIFLNTRDPVTITVNCELRITVGFQVSIKRSARVLLLCIYFIHFPVPEVIFSPFGWILLFSSIALYLIYNTFIREYVDEVKKSKELEKLKKFGVFYFDSICLFFKSRFSSVFLFLGSFRIYYDYCV